ncbi:ArsR/SmtB family transcription factor [Erythrobacter sp. HA6-11]
MVEYRIDQDALFRALADPSRRQIVERLSQGECTVGALAEPMNMSLAGASKHIGVLEEAGVLRREKRGRERVCKLDPNALFALRDWVERYAVFWDERLDALDKALKENGDG